jgi:hypothetical protein
MRLFKRRLECSLEITQAIAGHFGERKYTFEISRSILPGAAFT